MEERNCPRGGRKARSTQCSEGGESGLPSKDGHPNQDPNGPGEMRKQKGPWALARRRSRESSFENRGGPKVAGVPCQGWGMRGLGLEASKAKGPFPRVSADGHREKMEHGRNRSPEHNSRAGKQTQEGRGWLSPGQPCWPWDVRSKGGDGRFGRKSWHKFKGRR